MKFLELKEQIKELSKEIKDMKGQRKKPFCKFSSGYVPGLSEAQYEVRHQHIAYCLLRGRSYSEIEKPKRVDKPNMSYVSDIMESIEPREVAHEEAICCS